MRPEMNTRAPSFTGEVVVAPLKGTSNPPTFNDDFGSDVRSFSTCYQFDFRHRSNGRECFTTKSKRCDCAQVWSTNDVARSEVVLKHSVGVPRFDEFHEIGKPGVQASELC